MSEIRNRTHEAVHRRVELLLKEAIEQQSGVRLKALCDDIGVLGYIDQQPLRVQTENCQHDQLLNRFLLYLRQDLTQEEIRIYRDQGLQQVKLLFDKLGLFAHRDQRADVKIHDVQIALVGVNSAVVLLVFENVNRLQCRSNLLCVHV